MVKSLKSLKINGFEGLAGCVRERKRLQTNIKNDTKQHTKINAESMLEKEMQKNIEIIKNEIPKGFNIIQKSIPKSGKK